MFLTDEQTREFVSYMKETVGVTNHDTIKDAIGFAKWWVVEGGNPNPANLWKYFLSHSVTASNTNHFETTVEQS